MGPSPQPGVGRDAQRCALTCASALARNLPGNRDVITVLALNFVGDGLRDALDPRGLADEA